MCLIARLSEIFAETHSFLVEHINKGRLLRKNTLVIITLLVHKHVATLDCHSRLDKFLRLKEALQMPHLPDACAQQDHRLRDRPPEDSLVRAFARLPETLLTVLQLNKLSIRIATRQGSLFHL